MGGKTMSTFRGFISIDIQPTQLIYEFEQKIRQSNADVKLVDPEILHITLKFLGDVAIEDQETIYHSIKEAIVAFQPFKISLHGTGVFPNQNYIKVIWIGIDGSEPIKKLAEVINKKLETLGFPLEKKEFLPHLTIGRMRTTKNKQQLLSIIDQYATTLFGVQEISTITFKKSDLTPYGPRYTTLHSLQLTRR